MPAVEQTLGLRTVRYLTHVVATARRATGGGALTGQALDADTLPELHRLTRMGAFGWASGLKSLLLFAHRAEIADG